MFGNLMKRNVWLIILVFIATTGLGELEIERTRFRKAPLEVVSRSAEKGDSEAQLELALRYYAGYQVPANESAAYGWMRKSAEQKQPAAMTLLSQMYAEGIGVPVDLQASDSWFIAALMENPEDPWLKKKFDQRVNNPKKTDGDADDFLEKCAAAGYPPACLLVYAPDASRLYRSGEYQKALPLLQKLADAGDEESTLRLARIFAQGLGGFQRDEDRARILYQKIAEKGNAEAQYALAEMHRKGPAGSADSVQAERWYQRSAQQGNEDAKKRLDQIQEARFPYVLRPLDEVYPKSQLRGRIAQVKINSGKYLNVAGEEVLGITVRYKRTKASDAAGLSGIVLVCMELRNKETGEQYTVFNAYPDQEPVNDFYTQSELDVYVAEVIDPQIHIEDWAVVYGHLMPDQKTVAVLDESEDKADSLSELLDRNRDAEFLASRTLARKIPPSATGSDSGSNGDNGGVTGIIGNTIDTVIDVLNPFD